MNLIVMGVSGVGKTTVGMALAKTLGWHYIEGDAFHSAENRRKMASGIALTDDDRWPWLDTLVDELNACDGPAVLACSALKVRYRDRLRRSNFLAVSRRIDAGGVDATAPAVAVNAASGTSRARRNSPIRR